MASVVSPVNSASESVDSLITSAGTTGIMKGAVGARSVAGGDSSVAAVEVATQVDDAAFTPGTSTVVVIAGEADETATDSVDEGDAGALRMTLNRRLITAGHLLDDAAFGVGTAYVSAIAGLADETAPDSVDEGDVGAVRMTLDRRLHVAAAGDVAHDAVDSGPPVKIGGKGNSTAPSNVAAGDRVDGWFDLAGRTVIAGSDAVGTPAAPLSVQGASADFGSTCPAPVTIGGWDPNNSRTRILPALGAVLGDVAPAVNFAGIQALVMASVGYQHRGAVANDIVQVHGNGNYTILASAARTADTQSADQPNYNGRGLHLVIDATASADTPSVVFTIQGKDALSGQYYTILASAAVTGISTTVLRVYPGLTAVGNLTANDILPAIWRVDCNAADADSITYSIGASTIL